MKQLADAIGARTLCFDHRENGLKRVLGFDASPNTIDELLSTDVILAVGFTAAKSVMRVKLMQAAKNGAKIVLINPEGAEQELAFLHKAVYVKNDLSFLKELARALLDLGKTSSAQGFDAFAESLSGVTPGEQAREVAALYAGAKKAMILCQQNPLTADAAALLAEIAACPAT